MTCARPDCGFGISVRDLTPGRYAVWARFTAGTEQPVRLVGGFRIT